MTVFQTMRSASAVFELMEEEHGYRKSAPVDVDRIAELLGITVEYDASLERKDIVGRISFNDGHPVVSINPAQNRYEPRRRFTLAHEIGHYVLHSAENRMGFTDSKRTMSRTESYWDRYESEANTFAAQLLMPRDLVLSEGQKLIDVYKRDNGAKAIPQSLFVERLADRLAVSSKAMEYRLRNLGVIKQPEAS